MFELHYFFNNTSTAEIEFSLHIPTTGDRMLQKHIPN